MRLAEPLASLAYGFAFLEAARYRACAPRLEAARYRACAPRLEAARYRACASRRARIRSWWTSCESKAVTPPAAGREDQSTARGARESTSPADQGRTSPRRRRPTHRDRGKLPDTR